MSTVVGPRQAARRFGFGIAAAINATLLWMINVRPGWEVLPFLTPQTRDVLWAVNLSLIVGLVANVAYVVVDAAWFKAAGDLVNAAVGLVPATLLWRVFPFDFSGHSHNWSTVVRVVLIVAIVGSCIAILAQMITLIRLAITGGSHSPRHEVRR